MNTKNPLAVLGTIGTGAKISSVSFTKTPQERELLNKMKKTAQFSNKTIKKVAL